MEETEHKEIEGTLYEEGAPDEAAEILENARKKEPGQGCPMAAKRPEGTGRESMIQPGQGKEFFLPGQKWAENIKHSYTAVIQMIYRMLPSGRPSAAAVRFTV